MTQSKSLRSIAGAFGAMLALSGALAAGTLTSACSSKAGGVTTPSDSPEGGPAAAGDGGRSHVPAGDGGGAPPTGPDTACAAQPQTCVKCCETAHPTGLATSTAAFDKCICGPPVGVDGTCQTACAKSDCDPSPNAAATVPGDPCDVCETNATGDGGACVASIDKACNADPDCVALTQCMDQCP